MGDEEPAAKKAKTEPTGWEDYKLNISEAVMKDSEGKHLDDIANAELTILQGLGPHSAKILEALKLKTVSDLAGYKYFHMARALTTLAETETTDGRLEGSVMNVDKAVDGEYESKTLKEISEAPVSALQGLTDEAADLLKAIGGGTVKDLANLKYFRWAEAIVEAAKYENLKTKSERRLEAQLKKLS